ncbi:TetR/AcrR family transcriptional regulator ['Paenibacillus yunnanensis' Narsing Rao et al. 2020]|uniref:TetR/AcrR family transcriptional regulator n=1 Tax=Paenibacillus tengchongensis TaxID=2608684 RepID=UPI00124D357F|nr:TetR/AcrR family transcriptional regulator [Paenibacillus tengchongensis]
MLNIKGRSDGEETKKRIAHKAAALFVQKGYAAVTVSEVCHAAGVSKGSLYHHFPSKDELFLHVVEEDTEQWLAEWELIRERTAGIEERLLALAEHYANDFQNPLIRAVEEYARSRSLPEPIALRLSAIYESGARACRNLLQEGMDCGYLAPGNLDHYVIIVSGLLEGVGRVSEMADPSSSREDVKKYSQEAIRLLLQGMRIRMI